ncbi:MAG: lytic transglycosylase domain-containing protein [Acidobacteriota bacterium]|nr:lytic transglycosylase domain-containing protein [Acidobacteriota bacterium]
MMAGIWFSLPYSTCAQIVASVGGDGKTVFVNGDSPKDRHRSTISSPSAALSGHTAGYGSDEATSGSAAVSDPELDQIVRQAAERHDLDPALVKAVITTESNWNPYALSRKGAMGLMQLVPSTAERFGVGDPYDPAQNIEGGTAYLKELLDRYHGDLKRSLAAYNAGPGAVDASGGVPWYPETRRYVRKVTNAYFRSDVDHPSTLTGFRKKPVRREVEADGSVVFTNE